MISLDTVTSLFKTVHGSDPKTAALLSKLLDVEVLRSLGENRYLLNIEGRELTALSKQKLTPHEHYLARYETSKNTQPTLSHLVKIPKLFTQLPLLRHSPLLFEPKDLLRLLESKQTVQNFKETLLKELTTAPSKEHFQALSLYLLSLHQHVLSIPLHFYDTFSLLQFKKRYNKKTKKISLDFYAFFTHIGPVSGVISDRKVKMSVTFFETKEYLEKRSAEVGCEIEIEVVDTIAPLYEAKTQRVLDIVT